LEQSDVLNVAEDCRVSLTFFFWMRAMPRTRRPLVGNASATGGTSTDAHSAITSLEMTERLFIFCGIVAASLCRCRVLRECFKTPRRNAGTVTRGRM
jgi:hypothetical protein